MKINYAMIGYRIRAKRSHSGLSQQELAEKADLSVTYLSSIENARKKPSLRSLMCVSEALDITMDELITGALIEEEPFNLDTFLSECTEREKRYFIELLQSSKHLVRKYFP